MKSAPAPVEIRFTADPSLAYASSRSAPGREYRIDFANTLTPRCECTAAKNGLACGHVVALFEAAIERNNKMSQPSLRERLNPSEEQRALVPSASRSVTERQQNVLQTLAAARGGFEDAKYIATTVIGKGAWPEELQKDPEGGNKAALIIMTAAELGVSPIQAFSYIAPIKGKPFLMARMVNALVNSRVPGGFITITDRKATAVTGRGHRPGRPDVTVTITIEDAKRAKWTERNSNYAANPAAMLTARVQTTIGWLLFADVLAGMDVYDESTGEAMLAADVDALPGGAVIEGQSRPVTEAEGGAPKEPQSVPRPDTPSEDSPLDGEYRDEPDPSEAGATGLAADDAEAGPLPEDDEDSTQKFLEDVSRTLGVLSVDVGKNVGWGQVKVALNLSGSTQKELREEVLLWRQGKRDPIRELREAVNVLMNAAESQ